MDQGFENSCVKQKEGAVEFPSHQGSLLFLDLWAELQGSALY